MLQLQNYVSMKPSLVFLGLNRKFIAEVGKFVTVVFLMRTVSGWWDSGSL